MSRCRYRTLKFGRGYSPTLLCICRSAFDQSPRDIIAVTALALGCALHIQRFAVFIELLARERTSRRLGLAALTSASSLAAQLLLDPVPQFAAYDRLMLP